MDRDLKDQMVEAITILKKSINLLVNMGSAEASAAITMKLVDAFDAILDESKLKEALRDIWGCSYVISNMAYESFSKKLDKSSDKAKDAKAAGDIGDFRVGSKKYFEATAEITEGTGFSALFIT